MADETRYQTSNMSSVGVNAVFRFNKNSLSVQHIITSGLGSEAPLGGFLVQIIENVKNKLYLSIDVWCFIVLIPNLDLYSVVFHRTNRFLILLVPFLSVRQM